MQPDGTYRLDRPDGSWLAFSDRGELVRATDRLGNATAYEYSAPTNTLLADARRLDAVTDAAGQRIELAYAGDRVQSATMRIAAGAALRRVTFAFDGGALARADVQRPQPNGSFATIETTRYEYNADGQMSGLIGPDGVRRLANSSDWRGRSTERQDASGNRVGFQFSTDPTTGVRTTTATDAGATGRNDPLAHGTDALRFLAPGSASTTLTDAAGRVLSSTTADGFSTTFGYTGGLAPTSITLPTLGRADPGDAERRRPADANHRPGERRRAGGRDRVQPRQPADADHRPPRPGDDLHLHRLERRRDGDRSGRHPAPADDHVRLQRAEVAPAHDAPGRVGGRHAPRTRVRRLRPGHRDHRPERTDDGPRVRRPRPGGAGVRPATDRAHDYFEFVYNDLGQTVRTVGPTGTATGEYDPVTKRLTATTTVTGGRTEYGYTPEGLVATTTRVSAAGNAVTEVGYDRFGAPAVLIAPEGHRTAFQTDVQGRQTGMTEDDDAGPAAVLDVVVTSPTTMTVSVGASEPVLVATLKYRLDGQPPGAAVAKSVRLDGARVFAFDLTGLDNTRRYRYELTLTDRVGIARTLPEGVLDTTAPTADVAAVVPSPRGTAVSAVDVVFSEPVAGFDVADLRLTRDGAVVPLTGATLSTADNATWHLANLDALTAAGGAYVLTVVAADSGVRDVANNALAANAATGWTLDAVPPTAQIAAPVPNPRNTAVPSLTITFSEPLAGFDVADLRLTRNGAAAALSGAKLKTTDNVTWASP